MALEATFRALSTQMGKLCDTLGAVLLTVGDKPVDRGAALVDGIENTLVDMLGLAEIARLTARKADRVVTSQMDMNRTRRILTKCQDSFRGVEQQFLNQLVSYEKLKDLARLGRERGGEWKPWARGMKDAIEQAREPIEEASKAIAACWQELVEHSGSTSISVTSTGQRIMARPSEGKDMEYERIT